MTWKIHDLIEATDEALKRAAKAEAALELLTQTEAPAILERGIRRAVYDLARRRRKNLAADEAKARTTAALREAA